MCILEIFSKSWDTWVPQSVDLMTLDFGSGHDLRVIGIELHLGLHAQHGACLRFSLSLSLLLSLSLKIKIEKRNILVNLAT